MAARQSGSKADGPACLRVAGRCPHASNAATDRAGAILKLRRMLPAGRPANAAIAANSARFDVLQGADGCGGGVRWGV